MSQHAQVGPSSRSSESECELFSIGQFQSSSTRTDFNNSRLQQGCILSRCCHSCSYCNFTWAAAKERLNSRSVLQQNKACQRCPLCKSIFFCPLCSKCPTCCHTKASGLLASLAEFGCKSQSGVHFERRLFSALPGKATTQQVSFDCKQVRKPLKNKYLTEALVSLVQKQAVERVVVRSSLAFYNRLFLVPKPNRKW